MNANVWVAWLAVVAAIVLAVVVRVAVEPSNWVLGVILVPAFLLVGFILGDSGDSEPEAPAKPQE